MATNQEWCECKGIFNVLFIADAGDWCCHGLRCALESHLKQILGDRVRVKHLAPNEDDGHLVMLVFCPRYDKGNEIDFDNEPDIETCFEEILSNAVETVLQKPLFEVELVSISYSPYFD